MIEANNVDLPEPVEPVIKTMPSWGAMASRTFCGNCMVSSLGGVVGMVRMVICMPS